MFGAHSFAHVGELQPSDRPVTIAELDAIENEASGPIPPELREFLLKFGGSRFRRAVFVRGIGGALSGFVRFVGARDEAHVGITGIWEDCADDIGFNFVPVADDDFGNVYCVGLSGNEAGTVHFWDHETGELRLVAKSLEDFAKAFAIDSGD